MDKDEFLKLALDSEPTLFHVSFSILHNEQDCADAVQEAILKAYENRYKLKEIKYFKTWIVRIVINECYSLLRQKRRFQTYDDAVQKDNANLSNYVKESIQNHKALWEIQLSTDETMIHNGAEIAVVLRDLERHKDFEDQEDMAVPMTWSKDELGQMTVLKELYGHIILFDSTKIILWDEKCEIGTDIVDLAELGYDVDSGDIILLGPGGMEELDYDENDGNIVEIGPGGNLIKAFINGAQYHYEVLY